MALPIISETEDGEESDEEDLPEARLSIWQT
jgi:hypothetical protein